MSKVYKVWVEVELVDEDGDLYQNVDGFEAAVFDTKAEALDYARNLACS